MSEIVRSRTIHAAPEALWDVLADFASISRWAGNVDHSCLLHPADGAVGMVRRIQAGRRTVVERVVRWQPPRTLAYDIEGLPPVIRSVRNRWDLVPAGAASTTVTLTSTIDAGPRPPQLLVARVVGRVLARQSEVMLAGLAATTSGDSAAATSGDSAAATSGDSAAATEGLAHA